ncbi:MAG: GAP family protein [Actinomycetes bacterium]
MTGLLPLLARVGPLAAGAACSPAVLIVQMLVLTKGPARLARAWLFTLGNLVMAVMWMTIGIVAFSAAHPGGPSPAARTTTGVVHLVGAALLLALAAKNFYMPDGDVAPDKTGADDDTAHYGKAFLLGVGIMAANLTTVVLLVPATHDIAVSRATGTAKLVACAVLAVAAILPALRPPLLVTVGGDGGRRRLDQEAGWMNRHQHRINAVVCVAFAVYLAATGIGKI